MESEKVSEIEKIIKAGLDEEIQRSIEQLKKQIESETQAAVERINGVYISAIGTLRKLELTDATIFEFFEKTQGNIRVYEIDNPIRGFLEVSTPTGLNLHDPVSLKEKTKYKIILMAIEGKREKKEADFMGPA